MSCPYHVPSPVRGTASSIRQPEIAGLAIRVAGRWPHLGCRISEGGSDDRLNDRKRPPRTTGTTGTFQPEARRRYATARRTAAPTTRTAGHTRGVRAYALVKRRTAAGCGRVTPWLSRHYAAPGPASRTEGSPSLVGAASTRAGQTLSGQGEEGVQGSKADDHCHGAHDYQDRVEAHRAPAQVKGPPPSCQGTQAFWARQRAFIWRLRSAQTTLRNGPASGGGERAGVRPAAGPPTLSDRQTPPRPHRDLTSSAFGDVYGASKRVVEPKRLAA